MPLLKLKCEDCGQVFEELVPAGRLDKAACPACGGRNLQRHYQGKCYFGTLGGGGGGGGCAGGHCATCQGCHH